MFSLSSEDFPAFRLFQPRAALRGPVVRSLKDFSNSTLEGGTVFRSLVTSAGVFELTLTDFGWRGWRIVETTMSVTVVSCFCEGGRGDGLAGEADLTVLCG